VLCRNCLLVRTACRGLTIEKVEINIPQPEEQTAIATILSDMDTEITELDIKLSKARKIKQGMMQALLTGKTRLI
jgi:type I restriction enzyme, S subunit